MGGQHFLAMEYGEDTWLGLRNMIVYLAESSAEMSAEHRGGTRGGGGAWDPPPFGTKPARETRRFATRLAHVATLAQCTSLLYESLLHVLHT